MNDLGNHLDQAAGDPEPPLDLAVLQTRAAGRARTKRRALAGGAVAALLLVGGFTFAAVQGDGSGQVVAASDGGDGANPAETTTTAAVAETSAPDPTFTVETTQPPEGTIETVPGTLAVPTTTAPPTTTTTAPPVGETWFRVGGTYVGHEVYRLAGDQCPAGKSITHTLTSTLTVTSDYDGTAPDGPWTYKSDYCSQVSGDTWAGSGTFAISMPDGDQLLGTVDDSTAYPTDGEPYTIQITAGTGAYEGAKGSCELTVHITDKVFGSQTQSGDFTCIVGAGGGTTAPGGSSASAAFG